MRMLMLWLLSPSTSRDGNGMATTNKCLARSNKSRTSGKARGQHFTALRRREFVQNPDLYLFLGLLAGFAALLAIIYEFIRKSRRRKPPVVEPRRSTVTEKAVAPPSPPKHVVSVIAAEARRSAIALRSALREHQGPPAKGASTPHGSTFRSIRRSEAPGGPRSKWQAAILESRGKSSRGRVLAASPHKRHRRG